MNERFFKNKIILYIIGNIGYLFGIWLISVITANILGYSDAGKLSLAFTIANIIFVLASFGIRAFQISDITNKYSNETYIIARYITTVISFFISLIVCIILRYNLGQIFSIQLFVIYKCLEAISDVYHGILQKNNKLEIASKSLLCKGILSIIVFTVSASLFHNLNIALISIVLIAYAILMLYDIPKSCYRNLSVINNTSYSKLEIIHLLKETSVMMLFMLGVPLITAIPRTYLEKSYSEELLGIYSSVSNPSIIISTFASSILVPFLPKWSELHLRQEKKQLLKHFLTPTVLIVFVGLISLAGSEIFGKFILKVLYGNSVLEYAPLLNGVVIMTSITAILMCFNNLMVAIRHLKALLGFTLLGCLFCTVFTFYFVANYSVYGVTYTMSIAQTIQILIMLFYLKKKL